LRRTYTGWLLLQSCSVPGLLNACMLRSPHPSVPSTQSNACNKGGGGVTRLQYCFARRLQSHLPVESDERINSPALQQQRQPHAPVQSVRVPHHCVARNWHAQNEKPVGLHESLHFTHGAQVAVGVNRVAVSTEPVVLEVGYGNHEIERRPLRACAAVSARWVRRMACRRFTVEPFCICESRQRRVVPIQRVVPNDVRTEVKLYLNNVAGAHSMTVT
jgi:hypothetical protein